MGLAPAVELKRPKRVFLEDDDDDNDRDEPGTSTRKTLATLQSGISDSPASTASGSRKKRRNMNRETDGDALLKREERARKLRAVADKLPFNEGGHRALCR